MTAHEYPLLADRGRGEAGKGGQRAAEHATRYWSEMRLDWLRMRMEDTCSSN